MQLTQQERQHIQQMQHYMQQADDVYTQENRLMERVLRLLLRLLVKCGPASADVPRYIQALRLQDKLLSAQDAYRYGKRAALYGRTVTEGFTAYLSAVYCGTRASVIEREIWRCYRRLSQRVGHVLLDEFTELVRDLHSRSGELTLEVFEAGYLAGLQYQDAAGRNACGL